MPIITYILPDGSETALDVAPGQNLMHAAVMGGLIGIVGECGGSAMCATCHVYLEHDPQGAFGSPDTLEDEMLESTAAERTAQSRLSCQLVVSDMADGVRLRIPDRQT